MNKFFTILAKHDIFRHFCTIVSDPSFPSRELPLFYIRLRGSKSEEKKFLLNQIMIWFTINFKKQGHDKIDILDENFTKAHADACYQPTTVETRIKELFSQFKEQGIIYGYFIDFRFTGGYVNLFENIWDKC